MTIADNLAAAPTQEAFNEVLEAAGPTVDGGAVVGGFNASVQSIDVNNTRLASLRTGTETGMAAGEMGNGLGTWIQGFGQMADQDRRDGVDGYEADTYGLAVGLDTANLLENGTVGVALSYANTDVDSKNANRTNSDVNSYQASLYGEYDVAPQTYISGTLAYAWNDIDQTRHNVGGVSGLTAEADYDSDQYIAYLEAGRDFQVTQSGTLTPHVLAHYQHIGIDSYGEEGAGGANLNVNSEDLDIFELGVGAEMAWDLQTNGGNKIRPSINVGYRHDLVGDDVSSTSNFAGGGASFETNGLEPAQGTGNIGAALTYSMDNNWSFTADYDYEVKSDYDAHSGFVRAGYKF
jgi:outer membrane autotransporter protein